MSKESVFFSLLIHSFFLNAQINTDNFEQIDSIAINAPDTFQTITALTKYLTNNLDEDLHKTRAIYAWIASHIEYDHDLLADDNRDYEEITATAAFKSGYAICSGFSRLFQQMAELANLKTFVISGYSYWNDDTRFRFNDNFLFVDHEWNVINIKDDWYHIDLSNAEHYFPDNIDSADFLLSTKELINYYIPASPMWQFSSNPMPLEVFVNDSLISLHEFDKGDYNYEDSIKHFMSLNDLEKEIFLGRQFHQFNPVSSECYGWALADKADSLFSSLLQSPTSYQFYSNLEKTRRLYLKSLNYLPPSILIYEENDVVFLVDPMDKKRRKRIKKRLKFIERKMFR